MILIVLVLAGVTDTPAGLLSSILVDGVLAMLARQDERIAGLTARLTALEAKTTPRESK